MVMRRVFAVVCAVLVLASSALALSDKEYRQMKKSSPSFAGADKELNQVWKEALKVLGKTELNELKQQQKKWTASGRDQDAKRHIEEGMTRVEAYTAATNDRVHVLRVIVDEAKKNKKQNVQSRKVTSENLYSIYERDDGPFMEVNADDSYAEVRFSAGGGFQWESSGTIEGSKLVLTDEEDEDSKLTLTFSKWKKNLVTVITVKGNSAFGNRLDGTYKAYEGHM